MDENQINDIEVKDFIDLSPSKETMRAIEIENAKGVLKKHGYYVENLWNVIDVTDNYECSEEDAQEVLDNALTAELTFEEIWYAIQTAAEDMNLKRYY